MLYPRRWRKMSQHQARTWQGQRTRILSLNLHHLWHNRPPSGSKIWPLIRCSCASTTLRQTTKNSRLCLSSQMQSSSLWGSSRWRAWPTRLSSVALVESKLIAFRSLTTMRSRKWWKRESTLVPPMATSSPCRTTKTVTFRQGSNKMYKLQQHQTNEKLVLERLRGQTWIITSSSLTCPSAQRMLSGIMNSLISQISTLLKSTNFISQRWSHRKNSRKEASTHKKINLIWITTKIMSSNNSNLQLKKDTICIVQRRTQKNSRSLRTGVKRIQIRRRRVDIWLMRKTQRRVTIWQ